MYKYGVVIPTADRPALLCEALQSIKAQTVQPVVIVVCIDGNYGDAYQSVFSQFGNDVEFLQSESRKGAAFAREMGVKYLMERSVDYVAFLDDDDVWFPHKMECQLRLAGGRTGIILGSRYQIKKGESVESVLTDISRDWRRTLEITNVLGTFSNIMVHIRDALPVNTSLASCQDWHYVLERVLRGATVLVCDEVLLLYRVHGGPKITSNYRARAQGLAQFGSLIGADLAWWSRMFLWGRLRIIQALEARGETSKWKLVVPSLLCILPGPIWQRRATLGVALLLEGLLGFERMEKWRSIVKRSRRCRQSIAAV